VRNFIDYIKLYGRGRVFQAAARDDFGSGLISFSCLNHLPVDYLKIDGRFARNMDTGSVGCAMVSSIQQLGRATGVKTIAEFVGNGRIRQKLAEIGVDYAQGYGIARLQPLDSGVLAVRQTA